MQMKRKIGYRLAHIFLVLLGVSFLSFLLMYVSPGDPVRAMYAVSGSIPSEEVLEQTREELGLNDPFFIQYGNWISNCLRGDFGTSYSKGEAVATLLMERVMPTIQLALLSLVIMVLVAVPIGVYSALRQNSILDYLLRGTTFISISMPNFWVGLLLLYVVAMKLGWLPVVSNQMNFQRLILPAVTLAIDYVAGARARGLSERCVLWCHVLPNAVLPLITMLGLSLGSLLGGTAVVEVIFSYPALGSLAISAITSRDYPLIQGYVLWIALIYMAVNLVVDLSYNRLDPRLRKELQA